MADNLSIEAPDFDRIRKGDPHATEDAIRLLWFVANDEAKRRRSGDRQIAARLSPQVLPLAPAASQNNVDTQGCGVIVYTGANSVNVTGYRAPGFDGAVLFIHVTGAGTISHTNQDANSDAGNRFVNNGAATVAIGTNQSAIYVYYNSRWREWSAA